MTLDLARIVHYATVAGTMEAGFGAPVARAPLAGQSNVLLVAARGGPPDPPPRDSELRIWYSFGRHSGRDIVLTDDHCPVERLTAEDLLLQ